MYMDYHKKLSEIDEEKIQEDYEDWKEAKQYLTELENKIKINESKSKSLNHHNSDLMKFTYDENCEFCIKNGKEQIHEQEEIKTQIDKLYSEHCELTALYKKTEYTLEKLGDADERNREFKIFSDELNQIQHDAVKIGGKISTQESRLKHIESELSTTESNISRYYELEEKIDQASASTGDQGCSPFFSMGRLAISLCQSLLLGTVLDRIRGDESFRRTV